MPLHIVLVEPEIPANTGILLERVLQPELIYIW